MYLYYPAPKRGLLLHLTDVVCKEQHLGITNIRQQGLLRISIIVDDKTRIINLILRKAIIGDG